MAMTEASPEPEGKPETITIATISLEIDGNYNNDLDRGRVDSLAQQITRVLDRRNLTYSIGPREGQVTIDQFHVEITAIERGSIKATLKFVGRLIVAYSVVAAYPSFKEALPVIKTDVQWVLEEAVGFLSEIDNEFRSRPSSVSVKIISSEEFEVRVKEIDSNRNPPEENPPILL